MQPNCMSCFWSSGSHPENNFLFYFYFFNGVRKQSIQKDPHMNSELWERPTIYVSVIFICQETTASPELLTVTQIITVGQLEALSAQQ